MEYLCRPSEASTRYCVIPGGYPPQDWQSSVCWGGAGFEPRTTDLQSGALPLSHLSSLMTKMTPTRDAVDVNDGHYAASP